MDLTLETRKKKHKLSLYSTGKHKSLDGLDYVSAAGAKVFDELEEVIDKLGADNYVSVKSKFQHAPPGNPPGI